ncbi:hypothetical protein [Caballeronia mineralivorans]|uniref:hypothetical protein n=1 Tax=Caballeronia mineralivorans TaxID=2010198 RepID=UPI0023F55C2F|nr:hypothetical protein [Caballeronia mineralivorans]
MSRLLSPPDYTSSRISNFNLDNSSALMTLLEELEMDVMRELLAASPPALARRDAENRFVMHVSGRVIGAGRR